MSSDSGVFVPSRSGAVPGARATSLVVARGALRHSPLVRRLLSESGIRYESLVGSGLGGRLTGRDVSAAMKQASGGGTDLGDARRTEGRASVAWVNIRVDRIKTRTAEASMGSIILNAVLPLLMNQPGLLNAEESHEARAATQVDVVVETTGNTFGSVLIQNAHLLSIEGLDTKMSEGGDEQGGWENAGPARFLLSVSNSGGAMGMTPVLAPGFNAALHIGRERREPVVTVDEAGDEALAVGTLRTLTMVWNPTAVQRSVPERLLAALELRLAV